MSVQHLFLIASLLYVSCTSGAGSKAIERFNPPTTERIPVTDTYFGREVTDHYRWLENMKDSNVLQWLKEQADYCSSWLDRIPGRDSLAAAFARLDAMKPAEIAEVVRKSGRYFFKKTLPGEKTGKLYYREGKKGADMLLYDPGFDSEGIPYSITAFVPSEDGSMVALLISKGGAEVGHLYVLRVATKKLYADDIFPCRVCGGWSPDNKGVLYLRLNTADSHASDFESNTRTMYHRVGTDTSMDKEIFSMRKYPDLGIQPREWCFVTYTKDFKHLIAYRYTVDQDITCFYAPASDLLKSHIAWTPLLKKEDQVTGVVLDGDVVYMQTHKNAANYKVIKSDLKHFSVENASTVVPESKEHIVEFGRSNDFLMISYSDGINSKIKQYNMRTAQLDTVKLPLTGTGVLLPYGLRSNEGLILLTSWKQPVTLYDYNADSGQMHLSAFNVPASYPGMADIAVIETEVKSHDGTLVPLSIYYNKNVRRDGSANCLLAGYGAYGFSVTPVFRVMALALMNRGVIMAQAHVRGGGEKGAAWYKAGYKTTKPNTWKDFIACAEYLVEQKYTSKAKLIGMGMSAGGITIGRAITARPDLFGAAIDNVGCTNTLRMENTPNGPVNVPEFGTVKDSIESRALYEMDALHHVEKGVRYPAVICVGGMNDPRVIVWQPAKFAAKLQWATASDKPVFLQVNYGNGHFTEDKSVMYKNFANMFAFCLWQTGHPAFKISLATAESADL